MSRNIKRRIIFVLLENEFVVEGGAATNDNDADVGEDLVRCLPKGEVVVVWDLDLVTSLLVWIRGEGLEPMVVVVEASSLEEGCVRGEGIEVASCVSLEG